MRIDRIHDAWAVWVPPMVDSPEALLEELTPVELSVSVMLLLRALVTRRIDSVPDFGCVARTVRKSIEKTALPADVPTIVVEVVLRWAAGIDSGRDLAVMQSAQVGGAALWLLELELEQFVDSRPVDGSLWPERDRVIERARSMLAALVSSGMASTVDS